MSIRVLLSAPDGGGFAKYVQVEEDTLVDDFLRVHVNGGSDIDSRRLKTRVNREKPVEGQLLSDGDRVSLSYVKLEGAT